MLKTGDETKFSALIYASEKEVFFFVQAIRKSRTMWIERGYVKK